MGWWLLVRNAKDGQCVNKGIALSFQSTASSAFSRKDLALPTNDLQWVLYSSSVASPSIPPKS